MNYPEFVGPSQEYRWAQPSPPGHPVRTSAPTGMASSNLRTFPVPFRRTNQNEVVQLIVKEMIRPKPVLPAPLLEFHGRGVILTHLLQHGQGRLGRWSDVHAAPVNGSGWSPSSFVAWLTQA